MYIKNIFKLKTNPSTAVHVDTEYTVQLHVKKINQENAKNINIYYNV